MGQGNGDILFKGVQEMCLKAETLEARPIIPTN